MRIYLFIIGLFISCQLSLAQGKFAIRAVVVGVTDGDTFTALLDNKTQIKVRMHGIDAPEKKQAFGQVAKIKLSDCIYGKTVSLSYDKLDRNNRYICWVNADQMQVNEVMLMTGLAWHYTKYDQNSKWAKLESEARKSKFGLWKDSNPVEPWIFRKTKKLKSPSN